MCPLPRLHLDAVVVADEVQHRVHERRAPRVADDLPAGVPRALGDVVLCPEIVGDASKFMLENMEAIVATNEGRVLFIELPASVELTITYTEPGVVGDSATGRTKPATLETGHQIQVPLFVNQGEKVKVDTRDSSYLGRVKS